MRSEERGTSSGEWGIWSGVLRAADEDAAEENEEAADYYLEGGGEERRVHVVVADIGDGGEFDDEEGELVP